MENLMMTSQGRATKSKKTVVAGNETRSPLGRSLSRTLARSPDADCAGCWTQPIPGAVRAEGGCPTCAPWKRRCSKGPRRRLASISSFFWYFVFCQNVNRKNVCKECRR